MNTLFHGHLVRLAALNPEAEAETVSRWTRDSGLLRLMSFSPARPLSPSAARADQERRAASPEAFPFTIHALADDRLLGFINLQALAWTHGDAFMGINLGEREDWGKGYGTDALLVLLRYAFTELNLHRVSLGVFADNARAIRSYEKAGFVIEGRYRQAVCRDGRWRDVVGMGVLKTDWNSA